MPIVMPEKVTPLFGNSAHVVTEGRFLPDYSRQILLPQGLEKAPTLEEVLEEEGLDKDARSLWVGYPNLKLAVMKLHEWIGPLWPTVKDPNESAWIAAVKRGIEEVKGGIQRQENDRVWVIANFHNGLASIAADINGYAAWRCRGQKALDKLQPFETTFTEWSQEQGFDKIIFCPQARGPEADQFGVIWKMRAQIAPTRDLGVVHRYSSR